MRVFIGYSMPRGIYGRYVFTVLAYFSHQTETVSISVERRSHRYSCHHCGQWTSIPIVQMKPHTEKIGNLELYRYDSVEPQDTIRLELRDSDLLRGQGVYITVAEGGKKHGICSSVFRVNSQIDVFHYDLIDRTMPNLYEVITVNWDEYKDSLTRPMRVEEELVELTMRGEKITLSELLLETQLTQLVVEGEKQFIEGTLKRLS